MTTSSLAYSKSTVSLRNGFLGVLIVHRGEMRRHRTATDVGTAVILACATVVASKQYFLKTALLPFGAEIPGQALGVMTLCVIVSIGGAICGVEAVPSIAETGQIQGALLTHLKPWQIILGRMLAAASIPLLTTIISAAFWIVTSAVSSSGQAGKIRFHEIISTCAIHLLVLAHLSAMAGISYVAGTKSSPGRGVISGILAGFTALAIGSSAVVLINPLLDRIAHPETLIYSALLLSPIAGIAAQMNLDPLRGDLLYSKVQAHDYQFSYPTAGAYLLLFAAVSCICLLTGSMQLRRAYR